MKKIFTFILLTISSIAMVQAFPADPGILRAPAASYADVITAASVKTAANYSEDDGVYLADGVQYNSAATYSIISEDEESTDYLTFDDYCNLLTYTSAGKISKITITWAAQSDENTMLFVYAQNTPYANQLDEEAYDFESSTPYAVGTKLATMSFPGEGQTTVVTPSSKYQYVLIYGNGARIRQIKIEWASIDNYTISVGTATTGCTITPNVTEAESGTTVSFTLKGKTLGKLEAQHYTITKANGEVYVDTDIPEKDKANIYTGSFVMPASNVTISATFAKPYTRTFTYAKLQDGEGVTSEKAIRVTSGNTIHVSFKIDSVGAVIDTHTNPGATYAAISNWTYNATTGVGSFDLTGYYRGSTSFDITTEQNRTCKPTTTTISITVVPREVMLVSEYDGKYYAAVNTLTDGRLAAQEVGMNGEQVVIFPNATYAQSALIWKVCSKNPATTTKNKEEFTVQTPDNKFLNVSTDGVAEFEYASTHTWFKNNGRFNYSGNGIVYYPTDGNFAPLGLLTYPQGAKEYSSYVSATVQTIRSVTAGAFSTTCMPYSFIATDDLSVYTLDNKEAKADGTHFYFCRLDSGEVTEAGRPYIIKSKTSEAKVYQIGDENAGASYNGDGLYGVMENTYWKNIYPANDKFYNGNVVVFKKDGTLAYVEYQSGSNGGIAKNSACLLLSDIATISSCSSSVSGTPRRVSLSIEGQQEPSTPTAVENTLSADQIDWNEPVYNIYGQRVARGTTGVLIQNGHKFIAQ